MKLKISRHILVVSTLFMVSCAGYDHALLVTKTNVGIDIDTTPPTAEMTIARREIAIQPTYPLSDGTEVALPLLASFGLQGNFLNPRITSYFAGGTAANYIVQKDEVKDLPEASFCLKKEKKIVQDQKCLVQERINNKNNNQNLSGCPENNDSATHGEEDHPLDTRGWFLKLITQTPFSEYRKTPKPFYFATDTSFGIKVAWSGTTAAYPDTLKIGYNRKEFALPPIFLEKGCKGEDLATRWQVRMPSFLASTDNVSAFETPENSGVNHIQFFATGTVANAFANRPSVKRMAFSRMSPEASMLETLSLNQSLFIEIKENYNKAPITPPTKKQKIIDKAIALELVDSSATVAKGTFIDKLKKAVNDPSPLSSINFNLLRVESM